MSSVDTKLDCFDTYFDEDIYLDDLVNMSEEEREAYFKQLIDASDMTPEEQAEFQAAFDLELSDLYAICYEQTQQLDAIIANDLSTAADIIAAEAALAEIDLFMPYLTGDLSSDWGDAMDLDAEENVEITSGEDYTHSIDAPESGATYTITVTDDTSDSSFEDDESLSDDDGDGYNDDDRDVDNDGVADYDVDGDNVITEADMTYDAYNDPTTVTIDLDEGDSIEMSSYDAETDTVTFKITKADGTEYYLTIVGEADIYCSVLPTNLDSMPEDVTARMYEFSDSEHSYYYYVEGHDPEEYDSYYSVYQTSDSSNNTLEIDEPSTEDWENERSYTITMQDSVADTLTLNFGDDVTLEFAEGPNGELIIYASNGENTITITIENWSTETDDEGDMDAININGGIIDESDYSDLAAIANGTDTGSATYLSNIVANLIHHNGDDDSIYEDAVDDGYDWASVVPA